MIEVIGVVGAAVLFAAFGLIRTGERRTYRCEHCSCTGQCVAAGGDDNRHPPVKVES